MNRFEYNRKWNRFEMNRVELNQMIFVLGLLVMIYDKKKIKRGKRNGKGDYEINKSLIFIFIKNLIRKWRFLGFNNRIGLGRWSFFFVGFLLLFVFIW